MSLTNKTVASSYKDLLQVDNSNSGVDATLRNVKDGEGTDSSLLLSDDSIKVIPANDDTTTTFLVNTNSNTNVFKVDTTNQLVYASGNIVNTQYANFGIGSNGATQFDDDTHHALVFGGGGYGGSADPPNFGTGTDPATTFTASNTVHYKAGDITSSLWYIHDDISIDAIKSIV